MRGRCFFKGVKFIVVAAIIVTALGALVMTLWNHLMPVLFGWPSLHLGQALGLLVLSRILIGGFHGRPGMHWRHRLHERWEQMSPEEREKFRTGMGRCCSTSEEPETK